MHAGTLPPRAWDEAALRSGRLDPKVLIYGRTGASFLGVEKNNEVCGYDRERALLEQSLTVEGGVREGFSIGLGLPAAGVILFPGFRWCHSAAPSVVPAMILEP